MKAILILGCLLLSACTSISEVVPMADGAYFVQAEDRTIFKTRNILMESAVERANEFCGQQQGKVAVLVSQDSKGAPGWTGAASGIVFRCVKPEDRPAIP